MRIVVTGRRGQIVTALRERADDACVLLSAGRPELDLARPSSIAQTLIDLRPRIIIHAAAYTMVDKAEAEADVAMRVNADGAAAVAEAAQRIGASLLYLSTDYVFDGHLERPYREEDPTAPMNMYGRSKLAGEKRVAAACEDSVILRTAWIYSPFGSNFVRTMLRLGEARCEVGVVDDQRGNPTSALDAADAILAIAMRMAQDSSRELRGIFHMTAATEASWADIASEVFLQAERLGRSPVAVRRIATHEYPTAATRPANSRLDCSKLKDIYGVALPGWRGSLIECVTRLLRAAPTQNADV
jgi:dTDP-4-dehydrorhamnose reductase